ncbi:MAG: hypothetical protein ACRDCG_00240 [Mycoplasmoidaceae bacterium]
MLKKIKLILTILIAAFLFAPLLLSLDACSFSGGIYLGCWESYMSDNLIKNIKTQDNAKVKYFSSNEEAESKFSLNYNIAIPGAYVALKLKEKNMLEKINWLKISHGQIPTGESAEPYFSDSYQEIFKSYRKVLGNSSLLDWCIPYFSQNVVIAYKSNQKIYNDGMPLGEVIRDLSSRVGKNKQFNRIQIIDDQRTMYGLSSLIKNPSSDVTPTNTYSVNDFSKGYNPLKKYLGNDKCVFNTDSGIISSAFEGENGSDVMISYNGDLYQAANEYISKYANVTDIQKPKKTWQFYTGSESDCDYQAIDVVCVNKNNYPTSKGKQDLLWNVVKKISFDYPWYTKDDHSAWPEPNKNWSTNNCDWVGYNPPIKGVEKWWREKMNKSEQTKNGWPFENSNSWMRLFNYSKSTFYLEDRLIDKKLTDSQNFNMMYAWQQTKVKM